MQRYRPFLILITVIAVLSGCDNECLRGSGIQKSEMRNTGSFTGIETSGAVKIVMKQDSAQSVKVVADDNILEHIETDVSGSKLHIKMDGSFCESGPVTVYVSSKNFTGIDASGSVEIVSDGQINCTDFDLELSGASKITLFLNASKLKTHSSGASEINLNGQAGEHEAELSGASTIHALDFVTGIYTIESSGASKCYINVLNKLDIRSKGASQVEYRGNPAQVSNDDSGASSVRKIN